MNGLVALPSVDAATLGQGAAKVPSASDKTKEAAQQFEGLLMGLLFQAMRKTIQPSNLLGDSGHSRSTYEYLMDQAVANKAASSGKGWGLAERLEEAWSRRDEAPKVPAKG